jgi:hypothetical protein
MYVYAFVHPESGRTSWLLLPTVNGEVFSLALALFASEVGAGSDKQMVLLLDGAGWHKSATLALPRGIQLLFLPPYSPEVQQAPRLWPLSNEPLANRMFASLDELEQVQAERCRWLQDHPALVRAHTCFHWWPSLDST